MVVEQIAQRIPKENIRIKEPMKNHTTFRIGGAADCLVYVENESQLRALLQLFREQETPYLVVGNGSNLLVSDEGYRGVVVVIGQKMDRIECEGEVLTAEAGALLSKVASVALQNGLTGLEFAGGIPGTIGGGVVMNAGAYGGELKNVVELVTMLDETGERIELSGEEMQFGYRDSILKHRRYIVTAVRLRLQRGDPAEIAAMMEDFRNRRKEKQPLEYPSAGSTFKRPEGYFAGKLIEDAGLRGYRVGDAMVSEKHCGFVINLGNATEKEVHALMAHVQKTVQDRFGVILEPEVISV